MITIRVSIPVVRTARVMQTESLFDVPAASQSVRECKIDMPLDEKPWQSGLTVGPSGSGKSTIARHLWPQVDKINEWDPERAIVDGFPQDLPVAAIHSLLTSVGLGTTPSWLRPYHVLSTGEQFRANVA